MPRFLYSAHTIGLAGCIDQPFSDVIQGQATCALASIGGFSSAKVEKFNYRDLITFDSATSFVSGSFTGDAEKKGFETVATVIIEDLNILGVVRADRIVGRLVGRHPGKDERNPDEKHGMKISPIGSHFQNLTIAGCPVTVVFKKKMMMTMANFEQGCDGLAPSPYTRIPLHSGSIVQELQDYQYQEEDESPKEETASAQQSDQPLQPVARDPHILYIHGFGTIFLGGFVCTEYERRLTMLRVELGSPFEGEVVAGGLFDDGVPIWP